MEFPMKLMYIIWNRGKSHGKSHETHVYHVELWQIPWNFPMEHLWTYGFYVPCSASGLQFKCQFDVIGSTVEAVPPDIFMAQHMVPANLVAVQSLRIRYCCIQKVSARTVLFGVVQRVLPSFVDFMFLGCEKEGTLCYKPGMSPCQEIGLLRSTESSKQHCLDTFGREEPIVDMSSSVKLSEII